MFRCSITSLAVLSLLSLSQARTLPIDIGDEVETLPVHNLRSFSNGPPLLKGIVSSSTGSIKASDLKSAISQGYSHALIRAYTYNTTKNEGDVNEEFAANTRQAKEADFKYIDALWQPCIGSITVCEKYSIQAQKFVENMHKRDLPINRIFVEIAANPQGGAGSWQHEFRTTLRTSRVGNNDLNAAGGQKAHEANIKQAQDIIRELKAVVPKMVVGIYSSADDWKRVFGSVDAKVETEVPLWFVTSDKEAKEDKDSLIPNPKFGQWPGAVAKTFKKIDAKLPTSFQASVVSTPLQ